MGKWEMVRLGDVCDVLDSMRVPVTASDRRKGIYPYYGANGIQDYVDDYIFDDELVLLAEDGGNFGSKEKPIAYRVSGKCWVNNHAHVLKPKVNLNVDYLCYSIMFYDVMPLISGTTRAKLNQAAVRKMKIPLPPLPMQQKIADVLDRASTLIEKRKAQIEKMDLLIKSQFIEMFGDPVTNPKGWEKCKLGDVADAVDPQPSHRTPPVSDDGIPYIGIAECDYRTREIKFALARKVGRNVLEEHKNRYSISDGDFIIGKIGTIGKPFFVPSKQTYTLSANTVLIKPEAKKIAPAFLFLLFQSNLIENQLQVERKATSQPAFGIQKVRNIDIILPPLNSQDEFAAFIHCVEAQKSLLQQSLAKLELNYKSLMQKCFRGEIFLTN